MCLTTLFSCVAVVVVVVCARVYTQTHILYVWMWITCMGDESYIWKLPYTASSVTLQMGSHHPRRSLIFLDPLSYPFLLVCWWKPELGFQNIYLVWIISDNPVYSAVVRSFVIKKYNNKITFRSNNIINNNNSRLLKKSLCTKKCLSTMHFVVFENVLKCRYI